jgi:hypothetical protein
MLALELATVKEFAPLMLVRTIQNFLPVWLAALGRVTVLPALVKKRLSTVVLGMV